MFSKLLANKLWQRRQRRFNWRYSRPVIGALLSALCSYGSLAQAEGKTALNQFLTQVHSASGQFMQKQVVVRTDAHGVRQKSTRMLAGDFAFLRPGRFIWRYHTPYSQILQADGHSFYLFDPDLKQATRRPLEEALHSSAAAILFGHPQIERDFDVKVLPRRAALDWVVLTPKAQDAPLQNIKIGFRDQQLAEMTWTDGFGQESQIQFQKLQIDPKLQPAQFELKLPKDVDLIDD